MKKWKDNWKHEIRKYKIEKINWKIEKLEGIYEGELKDGKPHGYGKWQKDKKKRIQGEWKNGLLHGKAIEYDFFDHK